MSKEQQTVTITPPNLKTVEFELNGTAPYVQLRFSEKAMNLMRAKHELGSVAKKDKKRAARNFNDDYKNAFHMSVQGWHGIPASSFRNAMISACRICGFQMTKAKLAVFAEADGFDKVDGIPLIKIQGKPHSVTHQVRNATGVADLRVRAMWDKWSCKLRLRYDADLFSLEDISNLLARVGEQVGIGEGRPDSKMSGGMGWGTFRIKGV